MNRRHGLALGALLALFAPLPLLASQTPEHVRTHAADVCEGVLIVVFDLETFDKRSRSWVFQPDDGTAVIEVSRFSPPYWTALPTRLGGEGRLLTAHPDVDPATLSVRVVHRGIASSPRIAEVCEK